jgi:hypothetical protein
MKAESAMWKKIRPYLVAAKFDPVRVENPIHPGTPDVNLCTGDWIELKTITDWPTKSHHTVIIRHFTNQQRVFLFKRWRAAYGTTHLLLEVRAAKQWLLFDGDVAAKIVGRATVEGHRVNAHAVLGAHEIEKIPNLIVGRKGN